ncbi:helix-turn-helix domain-containing protein [Alteromonas sp. D210916BOD_24]|uniref:helix-turn-helix domain-containing protein n=1 Tax=Alteromonas sp. D210916BOD_24 TaxID=3157618 RepID=UPI00399D1410
MRTSSVPSLSIRSYTRNMCSHTHDHFQLVLPISGHIEIAIDNFDGKVGVGEGVCIAPQEIHNFSANELSKFVVADLQEVPNHLNDKQQPIFQVNRALQAFLGFVEIQLTQFAHHGHREMVTLFFTLLEKSVKGSSVDKRITPVLSHIHHDVSQSFTQTELARIACMGTTQFKQRFKAATGQNLRDYLVSSRMEKAKALLSNTDTPILDVALSTGYEDISAFSRRFKAYFGQPPGFYKRK